MSHGKTIVMVFFVFVTVPCCLLGWVGLVRDTHRVALSGGTDDGRCPKGLRAIGSAFELYYERHQKLPPAVLRDANGRRLLSWRVLLLPYLNEGDLYARFRLGEPWDSPNNRSLLAKIPSCYDPADPRLWRDDFGPKPSGDTHYHVVVGPGTAFEQDGLTWADFPDGRSTTILVIEARRAVPWTKPDDSLYGPGQPLPELGLVDRSRWGFSVCFADGKTRCLRRTTSEHAIHSMMTRNGGETVDLAQLE
jgi:Protein of unknown function (DUF1559)